ncbi:hypothetical protein MTP99_003260 [Tenebrio molitor]|nr:hypothetical protein MTP99_003260 [Tenebrio molitor]
MRNFLMSSWFSMVKICTPTRQFLLREFTKLKTVRSCHKRRFIRGFQKDIEIYLYRYNHYNFQREANSGGVGISSPIFRQRFGKCYHRKTQVLFKFEKYLLDFEYSQFLRFE